MVNINGLSDAIMRELGIYTQDVKEKIKASSEEVGKEAVIILKQDSPKLTGSYRKGWRLKKEANKVIIYNKTDPQLTHLLEKGHANSKGGGRTEPVVHIAPVEEKVVQEFISKVEGDIQS